MRIFISHSSMDAAIAEEICAKIEERGKKCFIAPRDISYGKEYAEEIMNGIDNAEAMIVLMSENANKSPHVLREVERAVSKSVPILVYKLEDVELKKSMEYFLMTHQWIAAQKKGDYSRILDFVYEEKREQQKIQQRTTLPEENSQLQAYKDRRIKRGLISLAVGLVLIMVVMVIFILRLPEDRIKTPGYDIETVDLNAGKGQETLPGEDSMAAYLQHNMGDEILVGDTVTFGRYKGEDISWRVLRISEDEKEAILIAEHILTMKAYDAAEGGIYNSDGTNDYWSKETKADTDLNLQAQVRGNSDWSTSNIRCWLNSEKEVVEYTGQKPFASAMSEHKNGYQNEEGFLYEFSEDELAILGEREIRTNGNALAAGEVITKDRVFLLSKEEMDWFSEADMKLYAKPTETAVLRDESGWYEVDTDGYGGTEYYWWLREPVEGTSSKCYVVGRGYTEEIFFEYNVGLEGFGIRPAIVIRLD